MKSKRHTDEFKREAVKQVTERGYSVADVAQRLDTTTHSLYAWLKKFGEPNPQPPIPRPQTSDLRQN
jgi:transposase